MDRSRTQLLVHYHIYKNAGTSVDRNLSESFGENWMTFDGPLQQFCLTNEDVAEFAEANPQVRAISSHHARPTPLISDIHPILFLRHPLDRAWSVYHFARRDPTQLDHPIARDGAFRDYVNWSLDTPGAGVVVRNYQVIHLSQASFRTPDIEQAVASPADLAEVRALLSSLPFFGLVRRFEESCQGLQTVYGPSFPGLSMRPHHENATTWDASEPAALTIAREELGEDAYGRFMRANSLDLALYELATALFDRKLARLAAVYASAAAPAS